MTGTGIRAGNPADAPILGVILAGGSSRRMGGVDKPLSDLAGRPMIAHVAERLSPQVARLIVSANGDPSRFDFLGLPVVADEPGRQGGPLAGLLAAMRWAEVHAPRCRAIASAPADCPFLPADLVARLALAAGRGGGAAIAVSGGRRHPVFGLWPVSLGDDLAAFLASGEGKATVFADRAGCAEAEFPAAPQDPFFNVNSPADMEAARRRAATGR